MGGWREILAFADERGEIFLVIRGIWVFTEHQCEQADSKCPNIGMGGVLSGRTFQYLWRHIH